MNKPKSIPQDLTVDQKTALIWRVQSDMEMSLQASRRHLAEAGHGGCHDYVRYAKLLELVVEDKHVELRKALMSVDTPVRSEFTSNLEAVQAQDLIDFLYVGNEALIA